MISVAPIDNTSLVYDPSWVSNALEQAERYELCHFLVQQVYDPKNNFVQLRYNRTFKLWQNVHTIGNQLVPMF